MLLTVSSAQSQNATWVGTTSNINTASNWSPSGVPSVGNTYTFSNTGITTTVTGNPAPGVLIVVNSSAGVKDYTISGVLSGATTVTKNGSSTLTLTGTNTYTGITNVNAGTLNIQNSTALGTTANGTVVASGAKLQLQNNITITGESLTLFGGNLVSATGGQSVTTYRDYEVRSFTSPGTSNLTVTAGGPVEYLLVGGGGGQGINSANASGYYAAPGGGGAVLAGTLTLAAGTFPVTVGAGGAGYETQLIPGVTGGVSSAFGFTANGGLGGGSVGPARGGASGSGFAGGGNSGSASGGGGGAGGPGSIAVPGVGGAGGIGVKSSITGTTLGYGGGGGGVAHNCNYSACGAATDGATSGWCGPGCLPRANSGAGSGANYSYDYSNPNGPQLQGDGANGVLIVRFRRSVGLENVSGINSWTGPVTLNGDNTVTTTAGTLNISGVISGSFALGKNGSGTLTLSNANTYSGGTNLNSGVLNINNASALGAVAGTFTIDGGTIDNTSGAAITTVNYPQAWNANFTFTGTNDLNLGTGAVTMNASTQVTTSNAAKTLTVGGVISGSGFGISKAGAGVLVLTGANTYSGITNVNAGTLNIQNSTALGTTTNGTVVASGAKLQLQNNITIAGEALTLYGGNLVSATGGQSVSTYGAYEVRRFTTSGSQTLTFSAGGTVDYLIVGGGGSGGGGASGITYAAPGGGGEVKSGTFSANTQSYTVNIGRGGVNDGVEPTPGENGLSSSLFSVSANGGQGGGTVAIGKGGASGSGFNGGGYNYGTDWVSSGGGGGAGGAGTAGYYTNWGSVGFGGNGGIGISSYITGVNTGYGGGGAGASWPVTGAAVDGGGTSYSNPPTANSGGGGASYSDGAAGIVIVSYINRGALENVSGDNYWTGTVSLLGDNTITTTAGTLTVSGVISGAYALTKDGPGTLTLYEANTYTGGTKLNAGTLNINNASALGTSAGTFTINAGTIDNTSGGAITTVNYPQLWNADFIFTGTNDLNLGTGAVTMSGSRQVTTAAKTLTVGGIINNNAQDLTKAGAGVLAFSSQVITLKSLRINAGTLTATSGILSLAGDFTNNSTFTHNDGSVNFNGSTAIQTLGGSAVSTFNNLAFSNTFGTTPQISFGASDIATEGIFSMNNFNAVNLNSRTFTLGKDTANPGTLTYTSGLLYGGTFKRWMSTPNLSITDARGYFPMGTTVLDFRPLWIGYSSVLTAGGSVSVSHNSVYPTTYFSEVHLDSTWGTGTYLQGISNSSWTISTANGLTFNGSTALLRFGGQGYGSYTLTDLNATLDTNCVGIFAAATNTIVPLEVNRTGLTATTLANTWYIGSRNTWSSPLPIELLSFEAAFIKETGFVELKWSTATEINNDFFTVESSQDGSSWTEILRKEGAGTTHQLMNYMDYDKHPYDGINYYRLKQTDYNGDYTYSKTIAINILNSIEDKIITFPNPVKNILNIISPGISFEEIFIIDNKGAIVAQQFNPDLSENIQVDFGGFAVGNYVIKLKTKNTIATKKITVGH